MTSSLVGSEMCIRDRFVHSENKMFICLQLSRTFVEPMRHLRWEIAVSYTHLTLPTICSV
eukprot:8082924-Prorocentrum_lima.AAC.1